MKADGIAMLKTIIIGASGYTGAELAKMVQRHPDLDLIGLYVSEQSKDAHQQISQLYGALNGVLDQILVPLTDVAAVAQQADIVLLATAHEVSHRLVPQFIAAGCVVFDLSGAYRVKSDIFYQNYYGFTHQFPELVESAVYGLAEWNRDEIQTAQLIAVPGCYATAAQLALKPLVMKSLLDPEFLPVICAVSGVSGAGRKAVLNNHFCEVSLHPYGVFTHRHQPEISNHLNCEVIFIPHIGSFKRGILATITAKLAAEVELEQISDAIDLAYQNCPFIRPLGHQQHSKLQSVQQTGYCDIGWSVQDSYVVLTAAIDNLLKGAASQAMQCINIRFGFDETTAIL